jgi:adenylate cyclase
VLLRARINAGLNKRRVHELEQARVRDLFARFVPEQVVGDVLARTDRDLRLGGVRMEATVLFSDLRGFTTFAETLPAEEVIDILNRYLSEMSDAILGRGGTLVSYMGDGIMAVFGAPIEQPDHADRALAAAREMLGERLPRFNELLRELGHEPLRMGIGLNSGPLMSGNVGHERRLEYTAIGDTTNTASRLEGMTKGTTHSLFVAESTRSLLNGGAEELDFVGELPVRGKQAPVRIWSPAE